jgi:predicted enzyme related to lactoylglutathione lyase
MPERTGYAQGTPSWVDLSSPDIGASTAFYGELFGWESVEAGPAEETGGYEMFTLRGKRVAGVAPLHDPNQPPAWSTYISVDDADAVAAKVTDAGGQVVVEPMDVMAAGRMAFVADPTGAFVGMWQAGDHSGAELVAEPGTLGWSELTTGSPDDAAAFYAAVFGMDAAPWENAGGTPYSVFKVDGEMVGGLMELNENFPPGTPPHWAAYFIVEDADAVAAKAEQLGGSIFAPPFDVPDIGRIAVLADQHGAAFSVMAPVAPEE